MPNKSIAAYWNGHSLYSKSVLIFLQEESEGKSTSPNKNRVAYWNGHCLYCRSV